MCSPRRGASRILVDLIASADGAAYRDTILKLLEAGNVDAVMAIYTTIDSGRTDEMLTGIINGVAEARRRGITQKPVVVCTMARRKHRATPCRGRIAAGLRVP